MNPISIIEKYYSPNSKAYTILLSHGRSVANKCLEIIKNKPSLNLDVAFVEEAAILHDIGMYMTNAPIIDCHGKYPYISHGYLGAILLNAEGYLKHALVAERHTGTGISLEQIKLQELPLPQKDMLPISLEEQLICFADKFFSKTKLDKEKSIEQVQMSLRKISDKSVQQFDSWCNFFLI